VLESPKKELSKPLAPASKPANASPKPAITQRAIPASIRKLIVKEVQATHQDGAHAMVSRINTKVKAQIPNFSYKTYGFAKMSSLLNQMSEVVLVNGNRAVTLSANQNNN